MTAPSTLSSTRSPYQLLDPLRPEEHAALEADIRERGVMVAVEVDENGNILDGHHRAEIAERLDLSYETVVRHFDSEAAKQEHVVKVNLCRRHLDAVAWGQLFAKLLAVKGVKRGRGGDRKSAKSKDQSDTLIRDVAEELGVPEVTAKRRLKAADDFEKLPDAEKKRAAESEDPHAKGIAVKEHRRKAAEEKREQRRAENRKKVDAAPDIASIEGVFATIVIDPPWDWGDEGDCDQLGRARPTFDTMPVEKIAALPVAKRADDDCHLYLWITNRSLPKGFGLLEGWGFRYVTCITWCKACSSENSY